VSVELVDPTKIETIVGIQRDEHRHWGRAVSEEQTVYILHSKHCVDHNKDLRYCAYSKALDEGIQLQDWYGSTDRPVKVALSGTGRLVPLDLWKGQVG
jgi:hypothetical protein